MALGIVADADTEHGRNFAQSVGEDAFVRRQLRKLSREVGGNLRIGFDEASRRQAIRLGENNFNTEHARLAGCDFIDQFCDQRARPRPLSVAG